MRLTLRTLLAYLDHTLDPADETALGEKVRQSSFATDLVQRIEGLLSNPRITAPSPDAVGPADDANAVAEYLDSTLVAEATAEVERQCIESDEHLAEVAASHQVLTIALGEPAVVPPQLRQRVYAQRPDGSAATVISGGNPAGQEPLAPAPPAGAVTPVGPGDSGVSDATTRLPQEADLNATLAAASAAIRKNHPRDKRASQIAPARTAMAGDRSREALEAIGPFLSGGRTARVTPWLVSLALAAAFLFVLTRAFEPYARRQSDDAAEAEVSDEGGEIDILASPAAPPVPAPELPTGDEPPTDDAPPSPSSMPPATSDAPPAASEAPPAPSDAPPAPSDAPPTPSDAPPVPSDAPPTPSDAPPTPSDAPPTPSDAPPAPSDAPPTPSDAPPAPSDAPPAPSDAPPAPSDAPPQPGRTTATTNPDVMEVTETPPPPPTSTDSPPAAPDSSEAPPAPAPRTSVAPGIAELDPSAMLDAAAADADDIAAIGQIENDGGLLLTQDPQSGVWGRLFTDSDIPTGTVLVSSPSFRSLVVLDAGAEVTLIGPTGIRIDAPAPEEIPTVTVDFGRLLITSIHGPLDVRVATPAGSGVVGLREAGATVAVAVDFHRPSGADPAVAGSSQAVLSVLAVQSPIQWKPLGGDPATTLETGARLRVVAGGPPQTDVPSEIPDWLDVPDESVSSIEATARSGLVEFLATDQPIEMALREAVGFRREEVAALAARTLLNIGMPDSYFGPSGVLNRPAQRSYWPELAVALGEFVDRGPHSTAVVARAVTELEGEAADELLRLVQGFSVEQLESGGDATLVAMLDHPVMSVRVLATETLRQITGTSLYFRPDYETSARRAAGLQKWEAKLNRDQIRPSAAAVPED